MSPLLAVWGPSGGSGGPLAQLLGPWGAALAGSQQERFCSAASLSQRGVHTPGCAHASAGPSGPWNAEVHIFPIEQQKRPFRGSQLEVLLCFECCLNFLEPIMELSGVYI